MGQPQPIREEPQLPHCSRTAPRWAQEACKLCDQPVRLLAPGTHELDRSDGSWLVSSDNIEGEKHWHGAAKPMPTRSTRASPSSATRTPQSLAPAAPTPTTQQATLTRFRGEASPQLRRITNPTNPARSSRRIGTDVFTTTVVFHSTNGKGPIEEPLACLRMLARHFDLPFRRDVLSRILNDQLERSGQDELCPGQAVAAICDLLGSAHHSPATRQRRSDSRDCHSQHSSSDQRTSHRCFGKPANSSC